MLRLLAIATGLLGILVVPLVLSPVTSWLALMAHGAMCAGASTLALREGWAGRPGGARAWGAFSLVSTGGLAYALQVASWERDGWAWAPPFLLVALWAWMPPLTAAVAGRLGEERRAMLVGAAVRARRRARIGQGA